MINSNTGRLEFSLAPQIEKYLYEGNYKSIYLFLSKLFRISESLLHCAVIYIPYDIRAFLINNSLLRDIVTRIESSTQINILFSAKKEISSCNVNYAGLFDNFESYYISFNFIQYQISKSLYPLILDENENELKKRNCSNSSCTVANCNLINVINTIPSDNLIENCYSELLNKIFLDKRNLTDSESIGILCSFFCIIFNQPEKISDVQQYRITDYFISDIRSVSFNDYSNIISSFVRSILFPSSSSRDRTSLSIDWHQNNPFRYNGFKIYRVDVLPMNRSGRGSSGTNRLIIAKNSEGQKLVVGYTANHDISERVIKERLRN